MTARKRKTKTKTKTDAPIVVTATRPFRHNGRRFAAGARYPADDPVVDQFPNFFEASG